MTATTIEQHTYDDMSAIEDEVEWEVKPVWNDPFENLRRALRGFCIPDIQQQHERAGRKCMRTRPQGESDDDDSSAAYTDHSSPSKETLPLSTITTASATAPLEPGLFEPILNLKKAFLTGGGFCDPFDSRSNGEVHCERSILAAASQDSDELLSKESSKEDDHYLGYDTSMNEEESDYELLIETLPGTSRSVRVYKALEIFVSAVIILLLTFHILRRFDLKANFQVLSKEPGQSSFFDIFT
jgi:hypothetical protein